MMGAATIFEGATCRVSADSCGRRKYMTVRIRRNVSRTNKIDMTVAPLSALCDRRSRSRTTMAGARGLQIASQKGELVLKRLAIQCRAGRFALLRFAAEASHFAGVRSLLREHMVLLQPP